MKKSVFTFQIITTWLLTTTLCFAEKAIPEKVHLKVLSWIQTCASDSAGKAPNCGSSGANAEGKNVSIVLDRCDKLVCTGHWQQEIKIDDRLFVSTIEIVKEIRGTGNSTFWLSGAIKLAAEKSEPIVGINGQIFLNPDGTLTNRVDLYGKILNIQKTNGGTLSYIPRLTIAPQSSH